MKNWNQIFGAAGAQSIRPRQKPWLARKNISNPGRRGSQVWQLIFFRPIRGLIQFGFKPHDFTAGNRLPLLRSYPLIAALIAVIAFSERTFAADVSADFSAANKLYAEGKFAEAAAAYEKILQSGGQSPALLFNAGNAEFKAGHLGKAIAAYRQAELLAPRDSELRANLAFVRNQVQGATVRESRWQNWVGMLTLNEGTILTAMLFWLMLGLFAIRQIRPTLVPKLQTATRILVVLTIFSATTLALQAANHFFNGTAVVTSAEATARSGPFDDAQSVFTTRDGAEFSVLGRHGDWVQITSGPGKTGWLPIKQMAILPGA